MEVEWTAARLVRKNQEGDRLGRGAGGGTRVKRAGFIKGDKRDIHNYIYI